MAKWKVIDGPREFGQTPEAHDISVGWEFDISRDGLRRLDLRLRYPNVPTPHRLNLRGSVPRHVLFLTVLLVGVTLTGPTLARADSLADSPINAREWNSISIAGKAKRLPTAPHVRSGDWVEVPRWNGYLRLALLGNQDPYKRYYRHTYVRCWSPQGWVRASQGNAGLLGFYVRGSSWIHAPVATCANAAKAARGQLSPTTIVALGTILHETFHRQGIYREDDATCLAAIGVWQSVNRHVGKARADRAWRLVIEWYTRHLGGDYRRGLDGCAERSEFVWNDTRVWR